MYTKSTIERHAKDAFKLMQQVRRTIHRWPELRWNENRTIRLVCDKLANLRLTTGCSMTVNETEGGIVARMLFDKSLPWIGFRGDLDALRITERTGLTFSSKVDGVMHACGHDLHAAILLGIASVFGKGKLEPRYNLALIFERAEENPGSEPDIWPGGYYLAKNGWCDDLERLYVFHVTSTLPTGTFFSREGQIMGTSGRFCLTVETDGGHVKNHVPYSNAIQLATGELFQIIKQVLIQNVSGKWGRNCNLEITDMQLIDKHGNLITIGGWSTTNIKPTRVKMFGGIRSLLEGDNREALYQQITERIAHRARLCKPQVHAAGIEFRSGHPTTTNRGYRRWRKVLLDAGLTVKCMQPVLGGESASYLSTAVRDHGGEFVFAYVGAGGKKHADQHTGEFNPDERSMIYSLRAAIALATT